MSTNSLLTPCKQGAVLSRYTMALAMSTNPKSNVRYIAFPNPKNLPIYNKACGASLTAEAQEEV